MAWTLVQKSAAQASGNPTATATLPGASTLGNLLIASCGAGVNTTPTPPAGWSTVATITNGTVSEATIFAYFNNPGGLSSFAFTGGAVLNYAEVAEFTCPAVSSLAAASSTGTNTAGAVASITVTTSAGALAGDLCVGAALRHSGTAVAVTWTDPTGYTVIQSGTGSQNNHQYGGYKLSATAGGAQSVTFTASVASSSATGWTGAVATFTQPAAAAAGIPDVIMAPMRGW